MKEDMEGNIANQNPVHPVWQLCSGQHYSEEDGDN